MLPFRAFCGTMLVAASASSAQAQTPAAQEQKPSMEELLQRIDALQRRAADGDKVIDALKRRVDELESREKHPKSQPATAHREPAAAQKPAPVAVGYPQPGPTAGAVVPPGPIAPQAVPALRPPEAMGSQYDGEGQDALRSDLPGLSLRIPGQSIRSPVLRLRKRQRLSRLQRPQPDRCADSADNTPRRQPGRHTGWRFRFVGAV